MIWGQLAVALFCILVSLTWGTVAVWAILAAWRTKPRWLHRPFAVTLSLLVLSGQALTLLPAAEALAGGRPRDGRIVDSKHYVQLKGHETEISPTVFHLLLRARSWAEASVPLAGALNVPMIAYCSVRLALRKRRLHNPPMQRAATASSVAVE